jgi:hypothetical protein
MQLLVHPVVFGAPYSVYVRAVRLALGLSSRRALHGGLCCAGIKVRTTTMTSLRGSMSHYNGIDWIAMCLTFSAIYLLGNKSRLGFVVMMLGNLLWCFIGLWAESYAMIIANLGFFSMNVRGFVKWAVSPA